MPKSIHFALCAVAVVALATGCSGSHAIPGLASKAASQVRRDDHSNMPRYIIVMVQENRTVDNLFQTQPGVDTQSFGFDSHNNRIPLTQINLGSSITCQHTHAAFVTEVTVGFDQANCGAKAPPDAAFSYVNPSNITQYTALASQ
jgi:phospholipase C